MIVDDEADVCVYVALALKRLGFESSATTDPIQALDKVLDDPDGFRLLLTDERMPGLTGLELIKRLWASHPDFPVVLMSGYGYKPSSSSVHPLVPLYVQLSSSRLTITVFVVTPGSLLS